MTRLGDWLRKELQQAPVGTPDPRLPNVAPDPDYAEPQPGDGPALTDEQSARIYAAILRELDCICPCHEAHDAEMVAEAARA